MTTESRLATAIVFGTGTLWGFYWLPVRQAEAMGLAGAWGTAAITAAAVVLLAPFALVYLGAIRRNPGAAAFVALGGAAFALYSVGLVYGRVAIIILLFFLTPVWSTLIGRFVMGWATPRLRVVAIGLGLLGLIVMLAATGSVPVPRSAGEWMALVAGFLWAIASTGIRTRPELPPVPAAFVFALGATIAAGLLAPALEPLPSPDQIGGAARTVGLVAGAGGIWWALSIAALLWATVRLDPARVGILLMSEVLVGAASAAILAGETLHPLELLGGALVVIAGILEVWPVRRRAEA
ncbi:DMT family transporter [Histidinibacterium aquaticum]|uniref:DMT family transporter n=1 Tax=Histidinibacterium aquaticum TaxID=2613962 RepID=A0A5J5GH06_9RHOB|nr:DMT family transporter [Histidinibacterium aquaticum]KAA9006814.1 DMT family transporter [Histidinibacterium aquaticum]